MDETARVDRHPKADANWVEHAEQVAANVDCPHVPIAEVEDRGGVDDAEWDHAREQEAANVFQCHEDVGGQRGEFQEELNNNKHQN